MDRSLLKALGDLGHEVGTPLGSILMMSEMLVEDASGLSDSQQVMVRNFGVAAREVRKSVQSLVRLARIRMGQVETHMETVRVEPLVARLGDLGLVDASPEDRTGVSMVTDSRRLIEMVEALVAHLGAERLRMVWGASPQSAVVPGSEPDGPMMGLRIEGELASPVPRDEPTILDPLLTGEMKLARRYGGAGLELAIAAAWARRLGGRLCWVGEDSAVGIELELPAVGRDPTG